MRICPRTISRIVIPPYPPPKAIALDLATFPCNFGSMTVESKPTNNVSGFITRWQGQEGGQERANYALFLTELCDLLGVDHPQPAGATRERNDYVFERVVTRHKDDGDALGRI